MLHLTVNDGLCRRLIAIVCAMRYCRDIQHELTIYWKLPVGRTGLRYSSQKIFLNENLNVFFQLPPNIHLKKWEPDVVKKLTDSGAKILLDQQDVIVEFMPRNLWGNPIYPDDYEQKAFGALMVPKVIPSDYPKDLIINFLTIKPFGYNTDISGVLRTYNEEPQHVWNKSNFETEVGHFAKKLQPLKTINNIIMYEQKRLFTGRPRVGFHFRRTDLRSQASVASIEKILKNNYLPRFKHWDIFICSDDLKFQTYLQDKFPDLKAYCDKTKVQNDVFGAQRAIVDLFLLASCSHIVGTRGSAFNYYAWLLSEDKTTFEYHS